MISEIKLLQIQILIHRHLLLSVVFFFFASLLYLESSIPQTVPSRNIPKNIQRQPAMVESPIFRKVADQIRFHVEKFQLDNGLTVLLHEDHSTPLVNIQHWFRVGSRHEQPGKTGLAHFFEHLMFKGTKKYPDFNSMMRKHGLENNAFTSHDYTGYYTVGTQETMELILDIESDRMQNLLFEQSKIDSEREVVKEERRSRLDNSIHGTLRAAMFGSVFKVHPYKATVLGSMADLNGASIDDLKAFYKTHYAPNNGVLIIVGAISIAKAKKIIKKYYGSIPPQPLPDRTIPTEPQQMAPRKVTLKKEVQAPIFYYAYKITKAGSDDAYALDILASILGSGESSRLHQSLVVKSRLATSSSAYAYTPKNPGVLAIFTSMQPNKSTKQAQKKVLKIISRFRHFLVTDLELTKAKNQVMRAYVDSLKSISGKTETLALNEIYFGDYSQFFLDVDRYQRVTKEDVLAVAQKYLNPTQKSLVEIVKKETL